MPQGMLVVCLLSCIISRHHAALFEKTVQWSWKF